MQASIGMLRALAKNPKVRAAVIGGARNVGLRTLARINGRRARKGRRVFVNAGRFAAKASTSSAAVPVRVNEVYKVAGAMTRVIDKELTQYPVVGVTAQNGIAVPIRLDPSEVNAWPKLAAKCPNYTTYNVSRVSVRYEPISGSAVNGQIVIGFSPLTTDANSQFTNLDEISAMPVHTTASISKSFSFDIPLDRMSQAGKGLYIPNASVVPTELTRYFMGTLAWVTYNCSSTASMGTMTMEYSIDLLGTQIDVSPSVARCDFDGLAANIVTPGRFRLHEDDNGGLTASSMRSVAVMVVHTTGVDTKHQLNGVLQSPVFEGDLVGGTHSIKLYDLGRVRGPFTWRCTLGSPLYMYIMEMDTWTGSFF